MRTRVLTFAMSFALIGLGSVAVAPGALALSTGTTARASLAGASTEANADSTAGDVDDAGEAVFTSRASNLIGADANGKTDVFVRTGLTTILISRGTTIELGSTANQASDSPSISDDGRLVAFRSSATNIVGEDFNGVSDIFVFDRDPSEDGLDGSDVSIEVISLSGSGAQGNDTSDQPDISGDGRWVAFRSAAANLVTGDTNGAEDVFLRDLTLDVTYRASVDGSGRQATGASSAPSVGADDTTVTVGLQSLADNLVHPDDANGVEDVFVWARTIADGATTTELVSQDSTETQGTNDSYDPSVSADGSRVAFTSDAADLVASDTNGQPDVFMRDRTAGTTVRASVGGAATQANARSDSAAISGDGSFIAFRSFASNLVDGDTNGYRDVFTRGVAASVTTRTSVDSDDLQSDGRSHAPTISHLGEHVAFHTDSTNLVGDDANSVNDVLVRLRDILVPSAPTATPDDQHVASGPWRTDPTITVTIGATDDLSGIDGYSVLWDTAAGTAPDVVKDVEETATTIDSPTLTSSATNYLHIRAVDNASNWGPTTTIGPFKIDVTAPTATIGTLAKTKLAAFAVTWSGTDAHSGIKDYTVRYRKGNWNAPLGAFTALMTNSTATTATYAPIADDYKFGRTICFSVKARDQMLNAGAYGAERCTALPIDDAQLNRAGWSSGTSTNYYRGTWSKTTSDGAYATPKGTPVSFMKRFAIVATKCTTCGKVKIYVNGALVTTLDTHASVTQYKQIIEYTPTTPKSGSVRIVASLAAGQKVLLDGVAIART